MATTSLAQPAHPSTREARALELYRTRGHEIHRFGTGLYRVPSCSAGGYYTVDYLEETCTCPDFLHGRRENCKHLLAVGILKASRRSGVREVRTLRVVAGDPFAYAAKRSGCPSCFAGYVTLTVEEDGQERDEPVPCRRCSR